MTPMGRGLFRGLTSLLTNNIDAGRIDIAAVDLLIISMTQLLK